MTTGTGTVADVMRPPVISVEVSAHLAAAAYLMKRAHDSGLVVVSNDGLRTPLGIVTDTDVSQAVADGRDLEEVRISDVLRRQEIVTVGPGTTVVEATRIMVDAGFHHLPVVQDGGVVGIVEMADLSRAMVPAAVT